MMVIARIDEPSNPFDSGHRGSSRGGLLLWVHKQGVIADFTTHGSSHIYGLPCPSTDSMKPMKLYYPLKFQDDPLKTLVYFCT